MTRKIILAGNATTAEILAAYLAADPRFDVVASTVDDGFVDTGTLVDVPCVAISEVARACDPATHKVVMAMGYNDLNRTRETMFHRLTEMGYGVETYIHPRANLHDPAAIGRGSVVLPGASVEPGAQVGENSVIWSNVTVGHHARIASHCWIAAGTVIAGGARVGNNSFLGVNATVVNEKSVGSHNIIGAGALITRNTDPDSVHLARSAEPFRFSAQDYVKHIGV